eukprot:334721_1
MLSIQELTAKYEKGTLSPVTYVKDQLKKLKRVNLQINAVAQFLDEDKILEAAKQSANRYKEGNPLSIFDGIVVTIKDIFADECKGIELRNGSALPEALQIPDKTAAHIDLILRGGAILICQTTTPEIGFKATTNSKLYGVTKNSRNLSLTSGGSSGGAASLCATGVGNLNFGSDGGGSIRIPASCCGIIGLKPSFGIGYVGQFPFLTHVAPLVTHMDDLRLYMEYICHAQNCSLWNLRVNAQIFSNMNFSRDYILNTDFSKDNIKCLRIGVSKTLDGMIPEQFVNGKVWKHILNAVNVLKKNGFNNVDFASPKLNHISQKRFFSIMATLWRCSMNNGYGPYINKGNEHLIDPVLLRIVKKGDSVSSKRLFQSLQDRDEIKNCVNQFFDNGYDILITPTLPILPPPAWTTEEEAAKHAHIPGAMGVYTSVFNLTHNPAISINCGFQNDNIPIGLQIVGKMYKDDLVMKFANVLQQFCGKIVISKL